MKTKQIVTIGLAIVLVVILYNLPKVIINKDNKNKLAEGKNTTTELDKISDLKKTILTENQIQKITTLRNNFNTVLDVEKRCNFADSLAETFISLSLLDSAAWYAEKLVLLNTELKAKATAADIYYNLYTLADEPTVANRFATKAQQYYKDILEKDPTNTAAKINMAMTYVTSENPMQAVLYLREILEKEPNNESAIFNLGILSLQSGQYDKALARFKKLIEINDRNWKAYLYCGVALAELGDIQAAEQYFTKVVDNSKDPNLVAQANEMMGIKK
jgi:tetratricopeptide (TPR) repeat protein